MYKRKIFSNNGFTLIELLVAITIITVGLMPLLSLQVTAIKTNAQNKAALISQNVIRQEIENIRTMGYQQTDSATLIIGQDLNYSAAACNAGYDYCLSKEVNIVKSVNNINVAFKYKLKLAVKRRPNKSYESYRRCLMNVSWQEQGETKSMEVDFIIGR